MARDSERGAAAVEFALLAPVLIMVLLGIMEFGRAYNVQISLSNAAREAVRSMAIDNSQAAARTAAKNAAPKVTPPLDDGNVAFSSSSCSVGAQMTVTVTYSLSTMTGITGPFAMTGKGTMLCGG